jgi:hypothetical protein
MRSARRSLILILATLAAALAACGESRETPSPAETPAPAAEAPAPPPTPAPMAEAPPAPVAQPASIHLEIFAEGTPEAASGGRGTLSFQGEIHPLLVSGVSLPAEAGAPKADVVGQVQQLARLEDIAGTYTASAAGATLGGGPKIAQLENPKGVGLKLLGKQLGTDVRLDLNGMQIQLAQ